MDRTIFINNIWKYDKKVINKIYVIDICQFIMASDLYKVCQ